MVVLRSQGAGAGMKSGPSAVSTSSHPKAFERDIAPRAEFTQQVSHPSLRQGGSDEIVEGQANHHITGIAVTDNLANSRRQERVSKQPSRSTA